MENILYLQHVTHIPVLTVDIVTTMANSYFVLVVLDTPEWDANVIEFFYHLPLFYIYFKLYFLRMAVWNFTNIDIRIKRYGIMANETIIHLKPNDRYSYFFSIVATVKLCFIKKFKDIYESMVFLINRDI